MFHKNAVLGDAHYVHAWEYADAAARAAATGFVAGDVKKLALQLDDNTLWQLTATTPTWQSIAAAGGTHAVLSDLATSGHPASIIANTPAGNIAATNVQAAINELDTEKSDTGHTHSASSISVTARPIGVSTNLDTALGNLDESAASHKNTGFQSWGGGGNYYSIATNQLTLLRPGVGFINGKKITWTAPQTAAAFTPNSAHWVYIDSTGTIGISTSITPTLYSDNIVLFAVHYDAIDYETVIENHPVAFDTDTARYIHAALGTVLTPPAGSNTIGADLTRMTTGTGAVATDRQLKIVGNSVLRDHGLDTDIPDSAGAAIAWRFYYEDASGYWKEDSVGTAFPMKYNNAGVMTALATSGAVSDVGVWTCYASKGEPNTGLPIYLAIAHNAAFGNETQANAVINAGTTRTAIGTIGNALEPAQLGTVIVTNNATSGYISTVNIAKATARSVISGGGANSATGITTNTTNFLGALTAADTNVQIALETLDRVERLNASIASAATTELSGVSGYVHVTGSVTITSFGTQVAGGLHHIVFDGAPLITHNGTSLILPGAVNIQAAAGDVMLLRSEGNGTGTGSVGTYWKCVGYVPNAVGLAAHLADTVDAHMATAIGNTPAGSIAATTVQAAINELDSEKSDVGHTHSYAPLNPLATDILWDAVGDLVVGSGANTAAKLSKGTALQVLRVNAGGTDIEWAAPVGGGDALVANPLSQFAATTSAQLAGVISDETGSGSLVFGTAPAITGGSHIELTGLSVRSTGTGAFDLAINNTENLTVDRTLTIAVGDTSRTLTVGASASVSGANTGDQTNISGNAATVTTNANLTGHVTSTGNAAVLGSFTVAQLNTAISDADVATGGGTATGSNTGDQTLPTRASLGLDTTDSPQFAAIELGAASDTSLSRSAAGVLAVEGVVIPSISSTNTLTNKRTTARVTTESSSATPTINTDNADIHTITALAVDITSMTTNLTGTPVSGDSLIIQITGTAARAITWGASFESSTVTLPSTTVTTAMLAVGFLWNTATSKWRCVASV